MRTIIAGGRDFICTSQDHVFPSRACKQCKKLVDLVARVVKLAGANGRIEISTVISGCQRGVDQLGIFWAQLNGIEVVRRPALWTTYGRAAGPIRNEEMITEDKADACIVIWDGKSPGSRSMWELANRYGLVTFQYQTAPPFVFKAVPKAPKADDAQPSLFE